MSDFNEIERWIKLGAAVRLRAALQDGLDANFANQNQWTLLMVAAMHGNVTLGRLFIEHGAQVNTRNRCNDTALSLAIQSGHPPFVELLLKSGASKDCNPHGNTLEVFLQWAEQYCSCSAASMKKIRALMVDADSLAQGETVDRS